MTTKIKIEKLDGDDTPKVYSEFLSQDGHWMRQEQFSKLTPGEVVLPYVFKSKRIVIEC